MSNLRGLTNGLLGDQGKIKGSDEAVNPIEALIHIPAPGKENVSANHRVISLQIIAGSSEGHWSWLFQG